MSRTVRLFPIALALGATLIVPATGACAEATQIKQCQTISKPGSYVLANNLTTTGNCLVITARFVTIDLAGFSITGAAASATNGVTAQSGADGITVRNGSISNVVAAVYLFSGSSIIEALRISGTELGISIGDNGIGQRQGASISQGGIGAGSGSIVTGNVVVSGEPGRHMGIYVRDGGMVSGNIVSLWENGITVGVGSTVIGNTVTGIPAEGTSFGITVQCPSNVIDNTVTGSYTNLTLNGTGCNNVNNVAP